MKSKHNYYEILHVQPDAPSEIIRSSYRTMMQRLRMHPDLGGDNGHAAVLNEAYSTLMEPANRAAYDQSQQQARNNQKQDTGPIVQAHRQQAARHACEFCRTPVDADLEVGAGAFCRMCHSPLFLAEYKQEEDQDQDRRSLLRVPNEHSLVFCTHWPQSEPHFGRTHDMSLNGMKFRSNTGLEIGQVIKLDSEILKAVARVTRVQWQGPHWEVGVKFISLSFEQIRGSFIRDRA